MSWKYKISLIVSAFIMVVFFTTQSLLIFKFMDYAEQIGYFGYACFISFIPFFFIAISEYIKRNNKGKKQNTYVKNLCFVYQDHSLSFIMRNSILDLKNIC